MNNPVPTMPATQRWIDWLGIEVELRPGGLMIARLVHPRLEHLDGDGAITNAAAYAVAEVSAMGAVMHPIGDLADLIETFVTRSELESDRPSNDGLIATCMVMPGVAHQQRASLLDGDDVVVRANVMLNDLNGLAVGRGSFDISMRHRRQLHLRVAD